MDYIGIEYKKHGRTAEGLDCYGLVKLYLENEHGVLLSDFDYDGTEASMLAEHKTDNEWADVSEYQKGDVLVLRQMRTACHVGVVIDSERFIHCEENIGVVMDYMHRGRWKRRIVSAHRHKALEMTAQVVTCENVFSQDRGLTIAYEGQTIHDIVHENVPKDMIPCTQAVVWGTVVPVEYWKNTRIKAGALIHLNVIPEGGARNVLRMVLSIAVIAFSSGAGGAFFGHLLGGANISATTLAIGQGISSMLGLLLVNALVPPARVNMDQLSGTDQSNIYSIAGSQNRVNQYGAVPVVLGKHRVYPPFAAKPYTELKGNDQWLHCLFAIGYGDLALTELKIGDTLLSNYENASYTKTTGTTTSTFPSQVDEGDLAIELTDNTTWSEQTTSSDTDRVSVDITLLQGLVNYNDAGNPAAQTAVVEIQRSPTGAATWANAVGGHVSTITITTPGTRTFSSGWYRIVFTGGSPVEAATGRALYQYRHSVNTHVCTRVEITSYGNGYTSTPTLSVAGATGTVLTAALNVAWVFNESSPQTVRRGIDITLPYQGQYDIRMRNQRAASTASNIKDVMTWSKIRSFSNDSPLNIPYTLTVVELEILATGQLNGTVDTFNLVADTGSSNPADVFVDLLTAEYNAAAVTTSEIDMTQMGVWETFCDTKGFVFNAVLDSVQTLEKRLLAVCAAGRATLNSLEQKYSVVIDDAQTTITQVFNRKNISSISGSIAYIDRPHALKCRFINEDNGYQQEEFIVYADGYDADNATLFESTTMFGSTTSDSVWKLGRYYHAVGELQARESWVISVDVEYLVCTRGSLVSWFTDIIGTSIVDGRISSFNAGAIELNNFGTLDSSTSYIMMIRKQDGSNAQVSLAASQNGESRTFEMVTPSGVNIGDLCTVYTTTSGRVDALVTKIDPQSNMSATLTLVPYNAAVYTADSGTIPTYTPPGITARDVNPPRNLSTNEYLYTEAGGIEQGVSVSWEHSNDTIPDLYEVQILRPNEPDWTAVGTATGTLLRVVNTPAGTYSFRVRAKLGIQGSVWVNIDEEVLTIAATPPADVINLQASYRNGIRVLTWSKVNDPRMIEYDIRFGNSWAGGSVISLQSALEYTPSVDGAYYIKARTQMAAVSTNAAVINVTGLNQATNVIQAVVDDWTGELTRPCYPSNIASINRWEGDEALSIPANDPFSMSDTLTVSTATFDNTVDALKCDMAANEFLGITSKLPTNNLGLIFEVGMYFPYPGGSPFYFSPQLALNNGEGYAFPSTTIGVVARNATNYTFKINGSFINVAAPSSYETKIVKCDIKGNGSGGYECDVYFDGSLVGTSLMTVSTLALTESVFSIIVNNTSSAGVLYIDSIVAYTKSYEQDYIKMIPYLDIKGYYVTPTANQLDLGHDDVVIGAVTKLLFHGSDSTTDLLAEDDLLSMDDLFYGASSQLIVQPQIRIKADGGAWGEWQNFINASYEGRYFDVRLEVSCQQNITAYITDFEYSIDMEDRVDGPFSIAVLAAGTSVVYDTPFQVVQHPQITQSGAASGDTVILTAESKTGFTVQILDDEDTPKDGTINWETRGY